MAASFYYLLGISVYTVRIADVDITGKMTEFVKNQILTQAAASMLSQAPPCREWSCR